MSRPGIAYGRVPRGTSHWEHTQRRPRREKTPPPIEFEQFMSAAPNGAQRELLLLLEEVRRHGS